MEQHLKNKALTGPGDKNAEDNVAYEDESNAPPMSREDPKVNNISPSDVIATRNMGTKWKHFVAKKRITEFSFLSGSNTSHLDASLVDGDSGFSLQSKQNGDGSQSCLSNELILYFANLARRSDSDVEANLDYVDELLKKGADINCQDKQGQGVLHSLSSKIRNQEGSFSSLLSFYKAASEWHPDIILFLLEQGADINMADRFGRTALHVAAAVEYPEMVEILIDKGAYIEARTKNENQTPLHFAAKNDAVRSLKKLIKFGADVEAKDYRGRTPIFVSAELDRSVTARFLLDINANVTVIDNTGQLCMTHMITKMGPVAKTALDQFHQKDRPNRKQYFHLNLLEVPHVSKKEKESLAKTPLEVIVKYRQLDLIMHPVMKRLIEIKWEQFGRRIAFRTLFINLIFVLIWTILGVGYPWQLRYYYTFPQDGWRVFLLVTGCLMTVYFVYDEVHEIITSKKKFRVWKRWREKLLKEDMEFCHPKWPEEMKYLEREKDHFDDMLPYYFQDFWNYCDWAVYISIFLVVFLHIIDASITNRVPVCCGFSEPCTNFSMAVCNSGFVNNANLSVWNNRMFVITILFLWLRMMKYTRAFKFFGPFIVVIGNLTRDILRFLYLYLEFYIPYACAFWMIFGNIESINTMLSPDQMLFSLFRITLVDEYQFPEMQSYDVVMAYILVSSFLAISAVLCINLFIALLSDTFQRIYDNAKANALMQQASLMLTFEEQLRKGRKKRFRKYIEEKCSPESLFYDDDLTVPQDTDLKKVTFKIKEQMDELMNRIQKAESKKRVDEDDDIHLTPRGGIPKNNSSINDMFGVVSAIKSGDPAKPQPGNVPNETMQKMSTKMIELSSRMQRLQVSQTAQEESYKYLSNDIKEIKMMLSTITGIPGGGQATLPSAGSNFGQTQSSALSTIVQQSSEARNAGAQDTSKGASKLFKKLLGGNKAKTTTAKLDSAPPIVVSPIESHVHTSNAALGEDTEVIPLPGSTTPSGQQGIDPIGSSNV